MGEHERNRGEAMRGESGEGDRCRCPACAPEERSRHREAGHGYGHGAGHGGGHEGASSAGGKDDMGFLRGFLGGPVGVGALVATGVMLLASNREKLKPAIAGTMKEYYRFSDWLTSNVAKVKEDLSDMAAEARHEYEQELQKHLDLLEKEREMVQRLANLAKKRSEEA